jgi:hypothetical protein
MSTQNHNTHAAALVAEGQAAGYGPETMIILQTVGEAIDAHLITPAQVMADLEMRTTPSERDGWLLALAADVWLAGGAA